MKILIRILALMLITASLNAKPGDLDFTYMNNTGKTFTDLPNGNYKLVKLLTLKDGNTILIGNATSGTQSVVSMLKLNYDGRSVNSFGTNGLALLSFNKTIKINSAISNNIFNEAVTFLGGSIIDNGKEDLVVIKINPIGQIDSSFGVDGIKKISISSSNDRILGMFQDVDANQNYVCGQTDNKDGFVAKFDLNFNLDLTFANNGSFTINVLNNSIEDAIAVEVGPRDRRVYVLGNTDVNGGNFYMKALYSNGTSFDNFGGDFNGISLYDFGGVAKAYDFKIQRETGFNVCGEITLSGINYAFVAKLQVNGIKNGTYGTNGKTILPFNTKTNSAAVGLSIISDGSILVGANNYDGTGSIFGIAKVYPDGRLDGSFGLNGLDYTNVYNNDNIASSTGITSNGKFYIAGSSSVGTPADYIIARYDIARGPFITTIVPYNITSNDAFSGGRIMSDGGSVIIEAGIVWDTVDYCDYYSNLGKVNEGAKIGNFNTYFNKLKPVTTYWVRAFARNLYGIAYGFPEKFKTLGPPEVLTTAPYYFRNGIGLSGGNVLSDGGATITKRGVVWDTIPLATILRNIGQTNDKWGSGTFSSTMTGLKISTTYYVRAFAQNSIGVTYGNEGTFSTSDFAKVVTIPLVPVNDYTFIAGGNVLSDGGASITKRGIVFGKVPGTAIDVKLGRLGLIYIGSGLGQYTTQIDGFLPDSTYFLRAFATNDAGTVYGEELSFTIYNGPTIQTKPIIDITEKSANSGGIIANGGTLDVSARGIVWSLFPTPTLLSNTGKTNDGTGKGDFNSQIKPLLPESFYYVRAYSNYNNVIGYGQEYNFWTLSEEPKAYPAEFRISKTAENKFRFNFSPAKTIQDCDGYVLIRRINDKPDFIPQDAKAYAKKSNYNSSLVVDVINNIDADVYEDEGFILDSVYFYILVPFNYNGSVEQTLNYKTDGAIPATSRQMTTSVQSETKISKFQVEPNPTSDRISFELPNDLNFNTLNIFDSKGSLVRSIAKNNLNSNGKIVIEVYDLASGSYTMSIVSGNTNYKSEFVIAK